MPRTLNVEKLEKKFASLTRSRESIQGLSSWIMHHKEFHQEIVDGWFGALKKEDFNALNMFYVANDVIQHCGKKKVPEYRTAFSTVLEKAVSLAKVKEIKSEVTRMLTLWHEKEIYDDNFFKLLETALNNEAPILEISDEEKELSESEIISTFELRNLVEVLENLKKVIDEVSCKEAKFKNMKCPENLNVDDLIVRMDKKDTYKQYKKADAYCKYVDDLIASFILLNEAREDVLKRLNHTAVFYNAQNEEVKKVVHAYRIYGKKLKIMEKSLSEKMLVLRELFPSPILESPIYEPSLESGLPVDSPTLSLNQEVETTVDSSQNSQSPAIECTEETDQSFHVPIESPRDNSESTETARPKHATAVSAVDDVECAEGKIVTVLEEPSQESSVAMEAKGVESSAKDLEGSEKNHVSNAVEGYLPDVDFLLEKAYDERQVKKADIKKKIETLLKAKGNKTFKVAPDTERDNQNDFSQSKEPVEAAVTTSEESVTVNSDALSTETVSNDEKMQTPPHQDRDEIKGESSKTDNPKTPRAKETICHSESSKENTNAGDKNNVPKISVPTPQSLSDIPFELLKSILDKNILNMSSQGNASQKGEDNGQNSEKAYLDNAMTCSSKHDEFHNPDLKHDGTVIKSESAQNVEAKSDPCGEVPKIKEENQFCDEIRVKTEKESTKFPNSETEVLDNEKLPGSELKNKAIIDCNAENISEHGTPKSSAFLEILQTTLKCFTTHNKTSSVNSKATEEKKCKSVFSDLTFENSIKMYSFLMQCHQAVKNKENSAGSFMPNRSETVNSGNSGLHSNYSNVAPQNTFNDNESSKHDNLELMDMEVDSEDDS